MTERIGLLKINRVFLLLIAIAMVLFPLAAAGIEELKEAFPDNDTEGYQPVDIVSIDPAIKAATPHYMFLLLDSEGKQTRISDVNRAIDYLYPGEPGNDAQKAEIAVKMQAIWDTYPVVSETAPGGQGYPTYGGSIITMKFAPHLQDVRLTDEENAAIQKSASLMNEAYTKERSAGSAGLQQGALASQPAGKSAGFPYAALACTGAVAILVSRAGKKT
jgi:hypothetical protein